MDLQISQIFLSEKRVIQFGISKVEKGIVSELKALLEEDATLFVKKAESSQIIQNISFNNQLEAPIEQNAVMGEATYSVGDNVVKKINIVADRSINKMNFINMTTNLLNEWFKLLR